MFILRFKIRSTNNTSVIFDVHRLRIYFRVENARRSKNILRLIVSQIVEILINGL